MAKMRPQKSVKILRFTLNWFKLIPVGKYMLKSSVKIICQLSQFKKRPIHAKPQKFQQILRPHFRDPLRPPEIMLFLGSGKIGEFCEEKNKSIKKKKNTVIHELTHPQKSKKVKNGSGKKNE
jgi:hypothetical protein